MSLRTARGEAYTPSVMNDFLHDPTTDQDDDFLLTADGLSFELCPSCLTVRRADARDADPIARIPLNLDHILGVTGGERIEAHTVHHHTLTVEREWDALVIRVRSPHLELARYRVPLPDAGASRRVAVAAA